MAYEMLAVSSSGTVLTSAWRGNDSGCRIDVARRSYYVVILPVMSTTINILSNYLYVLRDSISLSLLSSLIMNISLLGLVKVF